MRSYVRNTCISKSQNLLSNNKHQSCGYDMMLSNAQTDVLSIVNSCVSYKNKHKHHKCFACGLYGHIAADCKTVCKECSGKHLQSHCIVKLINIINDVFNNMKHDFVKDYNRLKAKVNKLLNPIIIQHKDPVELCPQVNLSIVDKPVNKKETVTNFTTVNLNLQEEFSKLSFFERLVCRPKYDLKHVHDLCEDAIRGAVLKQFPGLQSYTKINETIRDKTYSAMILAKVIQDVPLKGKCSLTFGKPVIYKRLEGDNAKSIVNKFKRFDALVKPFNQLQHIQNTIKIKNDNLEDVKRLVNLYNEKLCKLKDKYFDKKMGMIEELRKKAKAEFDKRYKTIQFKKQLLEKKLVNVQARLDLAYAFGPKCVIKHEVIDCKDIKGESQRFEFDNTIMTQLAKLGIHLSNKRPGEKGWNFSVTCRKCQNSYRVSFEDACNPRNLVCTNCNTSFIDYADIRHVEELEDGLRFVFTTLAKVYPQAFNQS